MKKEFTQLEAMNPETFGELYEAAARRELRDQFAMAVMGSMELRGPSKDLKDSDFEDAAQMVWRMADAMLKAREAK